MKKDLTVTQLAEFHILSLQHALDLIERNSFYFNKIISTEEKINLYQTLLQNDIDNKMSLEKALTENKILCILDSLIPYIKYIKMVKSIKNLIIILEEKYQSILKKSKRIEILQTSIYETAGETKEEYKILASILNEEYNTLICLTNEDNLLDITDTKVKWANFDLKISTEKWDNLLTQIDALDNIIKVD